MIAGSSPVLIFSRRAREFRFSPEYARSTLEGVGHARLVAMMFAVSLALLTAALVALTLDRKSTRLNSSH